MEQEKYLKINIPKSKYAKIIDYFLSNIKIPSNIKQNIDLDEFTQTHGNKIVNALLGDGDSSYIKNLIEFLESREINEYRLNYISDLLIENIIKNLSNNTHYLLEEYKVAIDFSNIVSKTDTKGIITYANDKFCEISGYSKDELIGKPHNIVRHSDMPKEAFDNLWQVIKNKKVWQGVIKNRKKDGSIYIVDAVVVPILDEAGEVIEYIAIRHDLTELIEKKEKEKSQIEDNLKNIQRVTEFTLESLIKTIPIATVIIDENCLIESYNDDFYQIFDIDTDYLLINQLKDKSLKINTLFKKEEGFIFSDDIFSWRENMSNSESDIVKIKELEFFIQVKELEVSEKIKYTVCLKKLNY